MKNTLLIADPKRVPKYEPEQKIQSSAPKYEPEQKFKTINPILVEKIIIKGDLSALTTTERVNYYNGLCQNFGLNPGTRPFEYILMQNKLVLYANKGCAEQLRIVQNISVEAVETNVEDYSGTTVIKAKAKAVDSKNNRTDFGTGAVNISGLEGDAIANAIMKAETKAKRRVTLSICGLNMLDECELDTIPDARPADELYKCESDRDKEIMIDVFRTLISKAERPTLSPI
ncbi:hypothetical protein WDW89_06625 [Deltaproteobacteria bacterium TL4]